MKRRDFLATLGSIAAASQSFASQPYSFSGKQLRFCIPYNAGGVADVSGRIGLEGLQAALGSGPVVLDNRPGANGNIGTEYVSRQPADGTNFLVIPSSQLTTNAFVPELRIKGLDVLERFVPVVPLADIPLVLMVNAESGVKSLADFTRRAKTSELRFGNPGVGTPHHLAALLLEKHTGVRMIHVAYKGGSPMVADLAGQHLDAVFSSWSTAHGLVASGKLKPLGSLQSGAAFNNLPSLNAELGGTSVPTWSGVFAVAGSPDSAMEAVNQATLAALRSPKLEERFKELGIVPIPMSRAECLAKLKEEARFMKTFLAQVQIDFSK
ncbi:Bug family tripartite tricarboxylate transporter substrate binding protein [Ottowia thiooxydans]|uniref:Tripartite-type tricarboxylate transporter receptor subunit TctC n=1 Tax=Ottowia thiooxydans TaxID=219182 RepID=A0ABV2Q2U9_9BURK